MNYLVYSDGKPAFFLSGELVQSSVFEKSEQAVAGEKCNACVKNLSKKFAIGIARTLL